MSNEMMKVHPEIVHHLDTGGLSVVERRIFKVISWMVRDEGSSLVTITFDDFRRLMLKSDDKNYEPAKLVPLIHKAYKKILAIPFEMRTPDHIQVFNVFYGFDIDTRNKTVTIAVNKPWTYLFTGVKPFIYYEMIEYQGLESGYAQLMYEFMKDFRTVGHFYEYGEYKLHDPTPIEEFREAMCIPDKQYRKENGKNNMVKINDKVLAPIKKELSPIFEDFKIEKIYKGRMVVALRFAWKPEPREIKNRISDDQRELKNINKHIQYSIDSLVDIEQEQLVVTNPEVIEELEKKHAEVQHDFNVARLEKEQLLKKRGWIPRIFGKKKRNE
jgi:plasmid replication initiation protein